jgi:hypothetical protein
MLGVSRGRFICLSTPFGQRGFFWREWFDEQAPWTRFRIPWQRCPRLSAEFIQEEIRRFGERWVAQEYECSFEAMEGVVYPDFDQCKVICTHLPYGSDRKVGGIDFGFRNPFAAIWGVLTHDDVLWINQECYLRETPLHEHTAAFASGRSSRFRLCRLASAVR